MFDFKDQSHEQVIDKALMDKTQTNNSLSVVSSQRSLQTLEEIRLQRTLPTDEDLWFRQAIQCTTCLNLGHSTVECTLRTHFPIWHSKAHTIDQCKYNFLNKVSALVRQIQPQDALRIGIGRFDFGTMIGHVTISEIIITVTIIDKTIDTMTIDKKMTDYGRDSLFNS